MAKYIPDNKTQRWVIVSQARTGRPHNRPQGSDKKMEPVCPFCSGNEHLTPPEVYRYGGGDKDAPGWQIRVVPNKYPITDIHEVIIHSPDHQKSIHELSHDHATRIIATYRERYRFHDESGQVLIFCNHGFHAGASLKHPHSQLVVVPKQINLDSLSLEPEANVIWESDTFTAYCPDFSQWPYEVWIAPKERNKKFGDMADTNIPLLALMLQEALKKIENVLTNQSIGFKSANEPFVYNYYIYHGVNWFLRIIPRSIHRAGFELGTGLSVNIVDPAQAAETLKTI